MKLQGSISINNTSSLETHNRNTTTMLKLAQPKPQVIPTLSPIVTGRMGSREGATRKILFSSATNVAEGKSWHHAQKQTSSKRLPFAPLAMVGMTPACVPPHSNGETAGNTPAPHTKGRENRYRHVVPCSQFKPNTRYQCYKQVCQTNYLNSGNNNLFTSQDEMVFIVRNTHTLKRDTSTRITPENFNTWHADIHIPRHIDRHCTEREDKKLPKEVSVRCTVKCQFLSC